MRAESTAMRYMPPGDIIKIRTSIAIRHDKRRERTTRLVVLIAERERGRERDIHVL